MNMKANYDFLFYFQDDHLPCLIPTTRTRLLHSSSATPKWNPCQSQLSPGRRATSSGTTVSLRTRLPQACWISAVTKRPTVPQQITLWLAPKHQQRSPSLCQGKMAKLLLRQEQQLRLICQLRWLVKWVESWIGWLKRTGHCDQAYKLDSWMRKPLLVTTRGYTFTLDCRALQHWCYSLV